MLRFGRKQQIFVKQLSFNKKKENKCIGGNTQGHQAQEGEWIGLYKAWKEWILLNLRWFWPLVVFSLSDPLEYGRSRKWSGKIKHGNWVAGIWRESLLEGCMGGPIRIPLNSVQYLRVKL